ncbi:MAG: DTW domain-containing protein [Planctomycetaceae bacterium]|nr:DTW domain-containing protein [Planctomycetaceae bacterium]
MSESLPTIIVVHRKERRSKCSAEPLRGRDGFEFRTYPQDEIEIPTNYVRLGIDGPLLSEANTSSGLLVLDGTWRWAEKMEMDYEQVPVRSLPVWKTAYPRTSKFFEDPDQGLATIEAIFAAYHQLGYSTAGLLDQYYWKEKFLEINAGYLL